VGKKYKGTNPFRLRIRRENKGVRLSYDEVCTALSDLNSDFVAEKFVDIVDSLTHLLTKNRYREM
jgi:hypothetical protein